MPQLNNDLINDNYQNAPNINYNNIEAYQQNID